MFAKKGANKGKIKNVRNTLESPFHMHWSERSEDEINPIRNALKELLPDAKLQQVVRKKQFKKNKISKESKIDAPSNQRQHNTFRQFLALGFQCVMRGLEKKDLCSVIMAGDVTPLLQKVVLAHSHVNNVPVTIIADLKRITKSALGFPTMVLGFKSAVADSTNKFNEIHSLVCQHPIHVNNESLKQHEGRIVVDDTDSLKQSSRLDTETHLDDEDIYCYRSQIGERAFIPTLRTDKSNKINVKNEGGGFGNFICLKQNSGNLRLPSVQNNDVSMKQISSSDDTDSDDDNMFFVDNKQDVSLLSKTLQSSNNDAKDFALNKKTKFKKNTKKGISFNMSSNNQVDFEVRSNPSLNKPHKTKKVKKNNKYSHNTSEQFHSLKIKTITYNSKKLKGKKGKNV